MKFKIFRAENVFWVLWKPKWYNRYCLCPELSTKIRCSGDEEGHFYSAGLDHPITYDKLNLPTEPLDERPGYFIKGQNNQPRRIVTLFGSMEETVAAISSVRDFYSKITAGKVCCIKVKPDGSLKAF